MPPKQTPHQLSKGLGYSQTTPGPYAFSCPITWWPNYSGCPPAFLVALQQRIAGNELGNSGIEGSDGRPPIPTRPEGEASGDDESDEEKPQVVVLRTGKHLNEVEVDNEKRKAKGLPPRPTADEQGIVVQAVSGSTTTSKANDKDLKGLSFYSASGAASSTSKGPSRKRKVIGVEAQLVSDGKGEDQMAGKKVKKLKKLAQSKALISFGDE
ncbi:hypothetical protein FRB98_004469 [Tulasnella sp. 332]|nr:hypothetical protein FRB98_004469 [Tulasnella sp. 332]